MKKLVFLLAFYSISTTFSQQWLSNLPQNKLAQGTLTFYDYKNAFYDYWDAYEVKTGIILRMASR